MLLLSIHPFFDFVWAAMAALIAQELDVTGTVPGSMDLAPERCQLNAVGYVANIILNVEVLVHRIPLKQSKV